MDSKQIFGGNPLGVMVRLALLSIVVGIVLSALGITPENFFERIRSLIQKLYDLGFGAIEWVFGYMIIGAMVVVPIWLIARLFGGAGNRSGGSSN
jgi:hypothetical protein